MNSNLAQLIKKGEITGTTSENGNFNMQLDPKKHIVLASFVTNKYDVLVDVYMSIDKTTYWCHVYRTDTTNYNVIANQSVNIVYYYFDV